MRQLLPVMVSAQMVTVLALQFIAVDSVKSAYSLAAYGKIIYISLLKKTRIHASWMCLRLPVSNYGKCTCLPVSGSNVCGGH